jgi:multiple sugar transport system permease protein
MDRVLDQRRRALAGLAWSDLLHYLRREQAQYGYLFVLPVVAFVAIFIAFPMLFSFYLSFHDWSPLRGDARFVGLRNYLELLRDATFHRTVANTAVFTVSVIAITLVGSLVLALALDQGFRGTGLFRGLYYSPVVTSLVATGLVWLWILDPQYGIVNQALGVLGLPRPGWAGDPAWALPAVILSFSWREIGYFTVVYLAGLQGIPEELKEAGQIDGAGSGGVFRHITWPLLWPTTLFVMIMGLIRGTQFSFGLIYVMTGGGPIDSTNVVVLYLYQQAFEFFRMGYASAIAYVLFIVVFAASLLQFRLVRSRTDF